MVDIKKTVQRWESELLDDANADSFKAGILWAADTASLSQVKRVWKQIKIPNDKPNVCGLMVAFAALGIDASDKFHAKVSEFWKNTKVDLKHFQEPDIPGGSFYPTDQIVVSFCCGVGYVLILAENEPIVRSQILSD